MQLIRSIFQVRLPFTQFNVVPVACAVDPIHCENFNGHLSRVEGASTLEGASRLAGEYLVKPVSGDQRNGSLNGTPCDQGGGWHIVTSSFRQLRSRLGGPDSAWFVGSSCIGKCFPKLIPLHDRQPTTPEKHSFVLAFAITMRTPQPH